MQFLSAYGENARYIQFSFVQFSCPDATGPSSPVHDLPSRGNAPMDAVRHGSFRFGQFLASTVPFAEGATQFFLDCLLAKTGRCGDSHTTSQNSQYSIHCLAVYKSFFRLSIWILFFLPDGRVEPPRIRSPGKCSRRMQSRVIPVLRHLPKSPRRMQACILRGVRFQEVFPPAARGAMGSQETALVSGSFFFAWVSARISAMICHRRLAPARATPQMAAVR